MPPTVALRPEQIAIIKQWIDQGAEWPDALSNEAELAPLNSEAVAMVNALAAGDTQRFLASAAENPKLLNARGPEGSTPFMYAVLYTGVPTLERLLKLGAAVNQRNDAGATALMWAAIDLEKTRLLVSHGADVNARSADLRPLTESSPLIEAATAADAVSVELLLAKGAEATEPALEMSYVVRCSKCATLLSSKGLTKKDYSIMLANIAYLGDANAVRSALDHGADVNAPDPMGRTPLMYAATSDSLSLDVVKLLVDRGADVNARDLHKLSGDAGLTALDMARRHGETPVVDYLVKKGARSSENLAPVLKARRENTIQAAIQSSLPLIQKADAKFMPKAACASCHNNSFAAMAVGVARKSGFHVDEATAAQQVKANVFGLENLRDLLHQGNMVGMGDFFAPFILGIMLIGLDAEHYQPDLTTDAVASSSSRRNWRMGPGTCVRSALAIQPYCDAGFPRGFDQWISAAATSWATDALAQVSPSRPATTSGER